MSLPTCRVLNLGRLARVDTARGNLYRRIATPVFLPPCVPLAATKDGAVFFAHPRGRLASDTLHEIAAAGSHIFQLLTTFIPLPVFSHRNLPASVFWFEPL